MRSILSRSTATIALAATAFLGGCLDVDDQAEPTIANIQITVGASTVIAPALSSSAQTPGPLVLRVNQANAFTIRFLDASGTVDAVVAQNPADFTLVIKSMPAGWSVTQATSAGGVYTGTITPTTTGAQDITVELQHDGHADVSRVVAVNVVT